MSFSMSPPAPKPAPSPAQYQQQQPPPIPQQPQHPQQQPPHHPPHYQQPAQQPSPANASPYAVPPPAKRQRLSPNPRSPPPPYQNGAYHAPPPSLPGASSYGNPYAPSPASAQSPYSPNNFAASPQNSFNTPQPYPPQQMPWQSGPSTPAPAVQRAQQQSTGSPQPNSQMMPPPPRPNKEEKEEKGVDDVTDVMHGSGINLKDEENYLHTLYTNQHTKDSFATQGSSFGSGTLSGGNSFNTLQGTSFDGQNGNGAFAGTLGQPASQDEIEKEAKRKREVAARDKAERDQHHLNNPFLLGNVLRLRMDKIARESGVRLDVNGLYLLQQPTETKVMANGTNSDGIVRAGSKIDQTVPFSDILSLVSLAAGERTRGLLDEAHALARARLYGDHNRVPPDLSDLAIAPGNEHKDEVAKLENITGTEWDRLPDAPGGPEDNDITSTKPVPTISFQSKINDTFRQLAETDRLAEQARIRKREARRKAAEAAAANDDGTAAEAEIAAATSGSAPSANPDAPKMTKKEQLKQQKEAKNAVEAQSSTTTNQTAAMMAMGKKGKKYSWMSGGSAATHTNRFAKPGATSSSDGKGKGSGSASGGTATPVKKEAGAGTPSAAGEGDDAGMVKWGDFKEDKGVQMRDWVNVLGRDGRERKALQRAMVFMK